MKGRILVIDDEKLKRLTLRTQLEEEGYSVEVGGNGFVGLEHLRSGGFDVVITDLRMPSMDGLTFLREIKKVSPDTEVIMMTAYGSIENSVEAMKQGAYDYITKPFAYEELSIKLERLMEHRRGRVRIEELQKKIESQYGYRNLIGRSAAMRAVFEKADTVADSDTTVMIQGETGTGKEMLANAIHYNSQRKHGPIVKVSCAIFNRELLESELFGHEKGAFTSAIRRKRGRFELADNGTIFLDDVDDIPLDLQVKLLRVIQEKTFERVGGEHSLKVDVRLICATKRDLLEMVRENAFREDLYYRLNVVKIELPPLRDRGEDILLLASHLLERLCRTHHKPQKTLSAGARRLLLRWTWPGNVRELENVIEHGVALASGNVVEVEDLPEYLGQPPEHERMFANAPGEHGQINFSEAIRQAEARLIFWALEEAGGNQARAAELLSIPRTTLRDKLALIKSYKGPGT